MTERTHKKPKTHVPDKRQPARVSTAPQAQRELDLDLVMRVQQHPDSLSPQDALRLQQTLGNRAVARLTGRESSPGEASVQRFADTVDASHGLNKLPYGPSTRNRSKYSVFYKEKNSYPHIHATEVFYATKAEGKARFAFNQIHWSDGAGTTYWWTDTKKDNKWNPTFADGNRRRRKAPEDVITLAKEFTDLIGGTLNEKPKKT